MSTAIQQARAEVGADNVLLLDAGDTIADTMIADLTKGRAVMELMNALRFDAMTLGNHEPDFGADTLRELIGVAKFPLLAANVLERPSGKLFTKPYLVHEVGGTKVGILGLAYPNTALTTSKKNVTELAFGNAVEAARPIHPGAETRGRAVDHRTYPPRPGGGSQARAGRAGDRSDRGWTHHNRMTDALRVGDTLIVQAGGTQAPLTTGVPAAYGGISVAHDVNGYGPPPTGSGQSRLYRQHSQEDACSFPRAGLLTTGGTLCERIPFIGDIAVRADLTQC